MSYDADQARAALAAFQSATGLRDFPWEKASGVAERALWKFRTGQNKSLSRETYSRLAAGASRLLERPVTEAELRGELEPIRSLRILAVIGADGEILPAAAEEIRNVPAPPGVQSGRALQVVSDSAQPMLERGDVVYLQQPRAIADRDLGRVGVVRLEDGSTALRRVLRGSQPGHVDLAGVLGGQAQPDRRVESIETIHWILKRGN